MRIAQVSRRLSVVVAAGGGAVLLGIGALNATPVAANAAAKTGSSQTPDCTSVHAVASDYSFRVNGVSVNRLENHVHSGDTVVAVFSVVPGCTSQVSLVAYTAPKPSFSRDETGQQIFSSATGMFTGGPHTLTVTVSPCFFQVDFVTGAPLATFGPPSSNNYYGDQHRKIDSENGGTQPCTGTGLGGGGVDATSTPDSAAPAGSGGGDSSGSVAATSTVPGDTPPSSGVQASSGVSSAPATGADVSFGAGALLVLIGTGGVLAGLLRRARR